MVDACLMATTPPRTQGDIDRPTSHPARTGSSSHQALLKTVIIFAAYFHCETLSAARFWSQHSLDRIDDLPSKSYLVSRQTVHSSSHNYYNDAPQVLHASWTVNAMTGLSGQ